MKTYDGKEVPENVVWYEWKGVINKNPVPIGATYYIKFRAFNVWPEEIGGPLVRGVEDNRDLIDWKHQGNAGDIIAYGVIEE